MVVIPFSRGLPNPGIAGRFFTTVPPGKPYAGIRFPSILEIIYLLSMGDHTLSHPTFVPHNPLYFFFFFFNV